MNPTREQKSTFSEVLQKHKSFFLFTLTANLLLAFFCSSIFAQDAKKVIATAADLPKFDYIVPENLGDLLNSDAVYQPFAAKIRADAETVLRDYDVQDKKELRYLKTVLAYLDFEENKFDAVKEDIRQIRELETADEKLRNGDLFVMEAFIKAAEKSGATSGTIFQTAFRQIFAESVNSLPDNLRAGVIVERDFFVDASEEYIIGDLTNNLASSVKQNDGKINFKKVWLVLSANTERQFFIALKDDIRAEYTAYLNSHKPVNIWVNREVVLTERQKLTPVFVGIWDSGVDAALFPKNMFINKREKLNGKDDDDNGYVDDIHGIAFDENAKYTTGELFSLAANDKSDYLEWIREKNLDADIADGIETAEISAYQQKMAERQKDESASEKYRERYRFLSQHAHGTEVASVIVKGNPAVRLVNLRISLNDATGNNPLPTEELLRQTAQMYRQTIEYFKSRRVRVVNMSWQVNPQEIADSLKLYNIGANDDERGQMARKLFTLQRDALVEAIKSAPEILFVCVAGNDSLDAVDKEYIPASFDLPNLLTIGAVDISGAKAIFTNTGKTVTLYGYGVGVPMLAPDNLPIRANGTSFASPQVAGLAAKLLALDPKLTVAETIALIRQGADASADSKMMIINPKRSIELLSTQKIN